jgi:hypothetical protein
VTEHYIVISAKVDAGNWGSEIGRIVQERIESDGHEALDVLTDIMVLDTQEITGETRLPPDLSKYPAARLNAVANAINGALPGRRFLLSARYTMAIAVLEALTALDG